MVEIDETHKTKLRNPGFWLDSRFPNANTQQTLLHGFNFMVTHFVVLEADFDFNYPHRGGREFSSSVRRLRSARSSLRSFRFAPLSKVPLSLSMTEYQFCSLSGLFLPAPLSHSVLPRFAPPSLCSFFSVLFPPLKTDALCLHSAASFAHLSLTSLFAQGMQGGSSALAVHPSHDVPPLSTPHSGLAPPLRGRWLSFASPWPQVTMTLLSYLR